MACANRVRSLAFAALSAASVFSFAMCVETKSRSQVSLFLNACSTGEREVFAEFKSKRNVDRSTEAGRIYDLFAHKYQSALARFTQNDFVEMLGPASYTSEREMRWQTMPESMAATRNGEGWMLLILFEKGRAVMVGRIGPEFRLPLLTVCFPRCPRSQTLRLCENSSRPEGSLVGCTAMSYITGVDRNHNHNRQSDNVGGVSPCTLTFPREAEPFLTPPLCSCEAA
jgi:hypothetical protein